MYILCIWLAVPLEWNRRPSVNSGGGPSVENSQTEPGPSVPPLELPAHFEYAWRRNRGYPAPVRRNNQPETENVHQNEQDPLFLFQAPPR